MKKIIALLLLFPFIPVTAQEVISPNKKISVQIDASQGNPVFSIFYSSGKKQVVVLPQSPLGITRSDEAFTTNLKPVSTSKPATVKEKYTALSGKRKERENIVTERIFTFTNQNNKVVNIIFRAYNDGVAFRYEFPDDTNAPVNVISENTTFILPEGTQRWTQAFEPSYEGFYPETTTGKGNDKQEWGFPALYKVTGQPVWVLLSEAGLSANNCAARLSNAKNPNHYNVTYPETRDNFKQVGAVGTLPWQSPWRTLIIGALADVVESTLVDDVNPPSKIQDTDWIIPGTESWVYWANNHGSKDYKKLAEYTDLAAKMNWPYTLIDWEWDVMENGGTIKDAVNYAKSKGVKPLMWYNSGTSWLEPTPWDRLLTPEKRQKEFAWLNEMGIYGIKVDFFAGDQQDMIKYYIDILEDAAKYKLLVNFHGATVPRGWARTYPHLLTYEAVYGAEWYNNNATLTTKAAGHNATLPFTRNVVGSMDYTPVAFSNSQNPHITSYAHELALAVLFESALQHFADSPESFYKQPDYVQSFLKTVPTTWDDTRLLDGYPGEKAIIARKKGNTWYIAGINGTDTAQDFTVDLITITNKKTKLELITDGADDASFATKSITLKKAEKLQVSCLPRGGFVAVLTEF
ncbi:alpha-glucosidase [Flavobacterium akiainvivens]|uniref:Alpha-glucosidase n=1 Tax=Flavobacterium akiainvivens TaxID=1202724 RepID=A0A0N0RQM4_9FLAO|nr:glycoside hydrolase family 97 protein [Flavobacterium akiainvivens]KOS05730.1 alpha-glucosidase [Flavobacterium akiainvivens]SFQ37478.1 Glycosyl-hydrolase 97 C-terminal, oligomerisation [Flavobacterium akiainvivens]